MRQRLPGPSLLVFACSLLSTLVLLPARAGADGPQAQGTPPAGAPPACNAPEYRQFDFWAGEWSVKDAGDGSEAGTNSITRILGGCVLLEKWRGVDGMEGTSFNIYDRADAAWHQVWVDTRGTRLDLAGGLRDGRMILDGKDRKGPRGGFLRDRITWTPLPDGRVRQHWEQSRDGGATWTTAFDGIYTRKAGS